MITRLAALLAPLVLLLVSAPLARAQLVVAAAGGEISTRTFQLNDKLQDIQWHVTRHAALRRADSPFLTLFRPLAQD